jgi:hypothetical protein
MILVISINFNKIKGLGFLGYLLIGEIFLLYLLKTFEFSDPLNELLFSFELITFTFLNFFPGGSSGVWFFIILSTSSFYFVIDPLLKKFIYKILLLILYLFLFFLPFFFIVAFIF